MTSTDSYATSKIQEGLYLHKYVEIIDGLRPDSTFSVDPSLPNFIDFYFNNHNIGGQYVRRKTSSSKRNSK